MITVNVDDLTFSSDPSAPLGITAIDGWFSGATIKTSPHDRANSDGVFGVVKFFRGARVITQSGLFTGAATEEESALMWRRLAAIMADGAPREITVTDPAGPLSATVILYDSGSTLEPLIDGMAEYVITFLAFDPVRYGPWRTTSTGLAQPGGGLTYPLFSPAGVLDYGANGDLGRVTVTNAGSADVWPSFTVTGTLTAGFFIQCLETGDVIRYDRVVPAGTVITIDSRTGAVQVDGVSDGSTYVTRDEFFPIPGGQSRTIQFNAIGGSSGAPQMTVREADGHR